MWMLFLSWALASTEVDPVELAGMLVRDAHWDRAASVLEDANEDDPSLDKARFHALRGYVRLHNGLSEAAAADLEAAIALDVSEPVVHVHLARAYVDLSQPERALQTLEKGGEAISGYPATWRLQARCHRDLKALDSAWTALSQGQERFPDHPEFARDQVLLLIELGLFQEALIRGRRFLDEAGGEPSAWMNVAHAMVQAGRYTEAALLLEEAHLRFPENGDVMTALARTYLENEQFLAAGLVLQQAAVHDPSLALLAAECFRRGGDASRAAFMNRNVPDPAQKGEQRLGLLIDAQQWTRAVALTDRLSRLALLDEDPIRYALAYAWYQAGDFTEAHALLRGIDDPTLFEDANALRQAMTRCEQAGWSCH